MGKLTVKEGEHLCRQAKLLVLNCEAQKRKNEAFIDVVGLNVLLLNSNDKIRIRNNFSKLSFK